MNPKLTKKLNSDFPETFLFQNFKQSGHFHFECGDGWYNLLNATFRNITHYIEHNNRRCDRYEEAQDMIDNGAESEVPQYLLMDLIKMRNGDKEYPERMDFPVAQQIKEKFGTLSIYLDRYDEVIGGITGMAETLSATTCEECGNVGEVRGGGWVKVLCTRHHNKRQKEIAERDAQRESWRASMVDRT